MNELPFFEIDIDGSEFQATPLNAELFTFAGQTLLETGELIENASRNHVFLKTGEADDSGDIVTGTFVFEPGVVQRMGAVMIAHGYPCRLNQRRIMESDEAAYQTYCGQQISADEIGDFIPDGWADDGKA